MSLYDQEQGEYSSELSNLTGETAAYTSTLNDLRQSAQEHKLQNEQFAGVIENSGILGMDVVGKIIQSKAFAYLTAAIAKSGALDNLKPALKKVVSRALGIDFDKPSNFAWNEAFNQLKTGKDIYTAVKSGNVDLLRQKLQESLLGVVKSHGPQIAEQGLRLIGLDVNSPENQKYIDNIRSLGITGDDLLSVAQGDLKPLAQRVQPVLQKVVIDKVSKELKLPEMPESGPESPFTSALKTLNLDDIQETLKGNYGPVTKKLAPVVKQYALDKIEEKYGARLRQYSQSGDSTNIPISLNDIKRAVSGDYGGLIDSLKPQVEGFVKDKLKETTGIDFDTATTRSPLSIDDLQSVASGDYAPLLGKFRSQVKSYVSKKIKENYGIDIEDSKPSSGFSVEDLQNISSGNYQPLLDKFAPKIKSYVAQKLKEKFGIDIDQEASREGSLAREASREGSSPVTSDDLKLLAQGKYKPILQKYEPQIKSYVANKIKESTGLDLDVDDSTTPINISDLQSVARGDYGPILSKYEPQIREQLGKQLRDKLGVNVGAYQDELSDLPLSMADLKSASRGDYTPVLRKLQTAAEQRTGVSASDLEANFNEAKTQALQAKSQVLSQVDEARSQALSQVDEAKTQALQAKSQVEEQVGAVRSQVQEQVGAAKSQVGQIQEQAQEQYQSMRRPAPPGIQRVVYYDNPTFDAKSADAYSGFRSAGARMTEGIAPSISETGKTLIGSLRSTATGTVGMIGSIGANLGVGIGASQISDTPTRDITQVAGSAGTTALLSGATKFAQSGATLAESLTEAAGSGAEAGILVGAQIGLGFIPDENIRVGSQAGLTTGLTAYQLYAGTPAIQSALSSTSASAGASGGASAAEAGASAADVGAGIGAEAAAEAGIGEAAIITAPLDAVPIIGEGIMAAVGLAALGTSLYFSLKDILGDGDNTPQPPVPDVGDPSVQYGL